MSSESSAFFNGSSSWSREQDKAFENALAIYYGEIETGDGWEKIAAKVPGRTVEEIKLHYQILAEDVDAIESGAVPLPRYDSPSLEKDSATEGSQLGQTQSDSFHFQGGKSRRGIAWTEDEHRLFLRGLEKYGKGDWKSISRHFVLSRSPAQVASHAQKYFLRLTTSANKERRRSSIYDITDVGVGDVSTPQEPITGQKTDGYLTS